MHKYLRAIGFSKVRKKEDLQPLLEDTMENHDEKNIVTDKNEVTFAEMWKSFAFNSGIVVCGEYDEKEKFHIEYYFPYFKGTGVSSREDIMVEKSVQREAYYGACDDIRVGVSLIFYLQNAAKYIREKAKRNFKKSNNYITLSGLSIDGMVLLPIVKRKSNNMDINTLDERNSLLSAARNGNEEAMEALTFDELDTYTMISKRIRNEDVFTIVDSYFMPYGMECDCYNIMGEIKDYSYVRNIYTDERLYQMKINCNDILFDICINTLDLVGEPEVGRRFKGSVWLQGNLNFIS